MKTDPKQAPRQLACSAAGAAPPAATSSPGFRALGPYRDALRHAAAGGLICLLLLGVAWAVYVTGGTRYSALHLAYLPIIVAGSLLGPWSGLGAGMAAGLLLGPFMPQDVSAQLMQQPLNWLIRLGFFACAGFLSGSLVRLVHRQQARLRWFALHSPATGLPNVEALIQDLGATLAGRRGNNRYSLLLVQIKNYEDTISALGGAIGVEIHKVLAERLQHLRPRPEQVYDLRGGKLAILLAEGEEGLEVYLRRLRRLADKPLAVGEVPIYADLSVGAVTVGYETRSPEELVQRANIALGQANQRASFYIRYACQDDKLRKRNVDLLARLPGAIQAGELLLEYQPKVDLKQGRAVGAEALVRWQHPQLGRIPPGEFIPLAERTALVHPLTRWVAREAIAYVGTLHRAGHPLALAINISPKNLGEPELFDHLRELIAEHRLPAGSLELEITESAILDSSPTLIDALADLRARGATVSIDDFGTGYTSLSYLAELPIDCLKIDQLFVRRLLRDRRQRAIVGSVIELAQRLELTTVAEGIEDGETAALLSEMGCQIGQGFLFSRPLPAAALEAWLAQERASGAR